jgi:Holliday junction resolvase RusA-like endonuclease
MIYAMTEFILEGRPVPYPRSRLSNKTGRPFQPAKYRQWLTDARYQLMDAGAGRNGYGDSKVSALVIVGSDLVRVRLETSETGRPKYVRGDLDNYVKAALDAIQGQGPHSLIDDDRQVVEIRAVFE